MVKALNNRRSIDLFLKGSNGAFSFYSILFQERGVKRSSKGKLALLGYIFYGIGIALFILGVAFSVFSILNYSNSPDSSVTGTVFLNSLFTWIIFSVIFLILAPVLFSLGTDKEQKILPQLQLCEPS